MPSELCATVSDGGTDAGATEPDAGASDAAVAAEDAGRGDAGSAMHHDAGLADASVNVDAGSIPMNDAGTPPVPSAGCGCRAGTSRTARGGLAFASLLLLALRRRR